VNSESDRMSEEAVVAKFVILSRDFPGGTEEGTEILSHSLYPDPDSNLTPPRYNPGAVPPDS
jgi:hypothetical protein